MRDLRKRPRGRPKGSEIDDRVALSRIAGFLVDGQADNVAAAVRRVAGRDPSLIRRLQRKFRRDRAALLSEARRLANQQSREGQVWIGQMARASKPLQWHREHDPLMRTIDALNNEQEERLTRLASKSSA
jgi:hypothetical protein